MSLSGIKLFEKEPYQWKEDEQHMIYTGNIDGKSREYLILNRGYINDGREALGKKVWFGVKWPGHAGSIYKVFLKEKEGGGISIEFAKKNLPIGYWQNTAQRLQWQIQQRAKEDLVALQNKTLEDNIEYHLRPIAEAYDKCRNKQERTVILSRVISYITAGRS